MPPGSPLTRCSLNLEAQNNYLPIIRALVSCSMMAWETLPPPGATTAPAAPSLVASTTEAPQPRGGLAHDGCPFCKIASEHLDNAAFASAFGYDGAHQAKQRWRRKHKKKRTSLKLGKWWRSIGYKGPNYCQRCSELFRDHILRQFSNTANCSRTSPCCNCQPVLRWFSDTGLTLHDQRQRRKATADRKRAPRKKAARAQSTLSAPVFCDASCADVLLALGTFANVCGGVAAGPPLVVAAPALTRITQLSSWQGQMPIPREMPMGAMPTIPMPMGTMLGVGSGSITLRHSISVVMLPLPTPSILTTLEPGACLPDQLCA